MKSKLRRLTFAALLLSGTSMTFAEDGASAVGDLPGYGAISKTTSQTFASGRSATRVGDLGFFGADNPNAVSDLGSNYVSDESTNVVSDLGSNIVGDLAPEFAPPTQRGTVVIGLAPSMLTDLPERARSNFVEAVPLPIIAPPTAVVSEELLDTTAQVDKAKPSEKLLSKKSKATSSEATSKAPKSQSQTPDGLQNVTVQPFQPIGFKSEPKETAGCDCGETCDGGCDTSCEPSHGLRIGGLFDRCPDDSWLSTEFLLWHTQDRESPPLVTKSAPNTFPVLPDAQVVFGDKLKGEFSGGFRLDAGKYLTDNFGVGGRFWILANNNDSYYADAFPNETSMGRPFFNSQAGTEDALLISGLNGSIVGGGSFEGTVAADSSINMWAAEVYTRLRLNCNSKCKIDFLSGYSHLSLEDNLDISSVTFNTSTADAYEFHDSFDTQNRFDGGQLGFEMSLTEGRWTFRSMTKVHLGNMNQQVSIVGTHVSPSDTGSGGLLALGNQGTYERDKFAFIPEANLKLEYCVRKNMALSIGYSFLYFDNVALAGAQIDPIIDPTGPNPIGISGPPWPANPAFSFQDSGMWVQGLDLGLTYDF